MLLCSIPCAAPVAVSIADVALEHLSLSESLSTPLLGVDVPHPRLSWSLALLPSQSDGAAPRTAAAQASYRITVADGSGALEWDSGQVQSNNTVLIPLMAGPMRSDTLYLINLTVWPQGVPAVHTTAAFRTGLLHRSDWKGLWITGGHRRKLLRSPPFRLPAAGAAQAASAFVSGVGYFELTCNGQRVSPGRKLDPGWTRYSRRVLYVAFDLLPCLRGDGGPNLLGIMLGNAWYQDDGWYKLPPYMGYLNGGGFSYTTPNQVLLQVNVHLATGEVVSAMATSTEWVAGVGPITFDSLYDGEHYDARLEQPGWDAAANGTAGADWVPALEAQSVVNGATLSSQLNEPIRVVASVAPVKMWQSPTGGTVCDFGVNSAGVPRIHIRRPVAGGVVTIRHAEVLTHPPYGPADGSLYTGSLRNAKATDVYTMRGSPAGETYEPRFTVHGFRYMEIEGYPEGPPRPSDVTAQRVRNAVPEAGALQFPDAERRGVAVLPKLHAAARASIASNFLGGPGSCAGRDERQFFTGDTALATEATFLNYRAAALYARWVRTLLDEQLDDGSVGYYAPTPHARRTGSPNWMTGFPTAVYRLWRHYADVGIIRTAMPGLERYFAFYESKCAETNCSTAGLARFWALGPTEWMQIGKAPDPHFMNAFGYVHDLRMMAEMAAAVAAPSAARYARRFAHRLGLLRSSFYGRGGPGCYGECTMSELALALWIGAPATPRERQLVADALVGLIESLWAGATSDWIGGVGSRYLFEALVRGNRSAFALRVALRDTKPSWGYMVQGAGNPEPATALWEHWDCDRGAAIESSRNHLYMSSIETFFYKSLAGIRPTAPGFARVALGPDPAVVNASNLTAVRGHIRSPNGLIATGWCVAADRPCGPPSESPEPPYDSPGAAARARPCAARNRTLVLAMDVLVPVGVHAEAVVPLVGRGSKAVDVHVAAGRSEACPRRVWDRAHGFVVGAVDGVVSATLGPDGAAIGFGVRPGSAFVFEVWQ